MSLNPSRWGGGYTTALFHEASASLILRPAAPVAAVGPGLVASPILQARREAMMTALVTTLPFGMRAGPPNAPALMTCLPPMRLGRSPTDPCPWLPPASTLPSISESTITRMSSPLTRASTAAASRSHFHGRHSPGLEPATPSLMALTRPWRRSLLRRCPPMRAPSKAHVALASQGALAALPQSTVFSLRLAPLAGPRAAAASRGTWRRSSTSPMAPLTMAATTAASQQAKWVRGEALTETLLRRLLLLLLLQRIL